MKTNHIKIQRMTAEMCLAGLILFCIFLYAFLAILPVIFPILVVLAGIVGCIFVLGLVVGICKTIGSKG